jgi:putative ABC transport system permease protein
MVSIVRKNLFHDKGRLVISMGGVAFSTNAYHDFNRCLLWNIHGKHDVSDENEGRSVGGTGGYSRYVAHYSLLPRGLDVEIKQVGGVRCGWTMGDREGQENSEKWLSHR